MNEYLSSRENIEDHLKQFRDIQDQEEESLSESMDEEVIEDLKTTEKFKKTSEANQKEVFDFEKELKSK